MHHNQVTRTGSAPANGAALYYEVRGRGPPMVLLHAGVADSRMWDDQFEVLPRDYQVIRYDLRGFGRSVVPSGPFAHHDDVAGLLDYLDVNRAHVIGVSFGGYVALDFTLAYPDRVRTLVLSAPNVSGYEPTSEELLRFCAEEESALERDELETAAELNVRMWVDGPQRTSEQVDAALRERVRQMQLQAFTVPVPEGVVDQPLLPPALDRLGEVRVPTLVIVGELDVPEFIDLAALVARRIQGAERATIGGAAHLPSMEQPELFNRLVLDFLGRQ